MLFSGAFGWQPVADSAGESFPEWHLVYYYFRSWKANGTLEKLNWQLNKRERNKQQKEETPSLLNIATQSTKVALFVHEQTWTDSNKKINGRKRHVITDALGLAWGVVEHGTNCYDGALALQVIAPLKVYRHRMETILADAAYEKVLMNWVKKNLLGVELKISSKPSATNGFVPVKWRWFTEKSFWLI